MLVLILVNYLPVLPSSTFSIRHGGGTDDLVEWAMKDSRESVLRTTGLVYGETDLGPVMMKLI